MNVMLVPAATLPLVRSTSRLSLLVPIVMLQLIAVNPVDGVHETLDCEVGTDKRD